MTPHPVRRLCSVAVTGGGSGFGREIALAFAARGCIVFGTAASAAEVEEVRSASGRRVSLAVCDISHADAATAWAGGVSDALDGAGLDILISHASVLTPGPIEVLPLSAVRRTFEVNVFGALTVINAFLPALRQASGRVVQLSSWTASIPLPFNGLTGASMAAIEALAAVYRAELKPLGVDMVLVPMGRLRTDAPAEMTAEWARVAASMTAEQRNLYAGRLSICADHVSRGTANSMEAADAAARLIEIAERHPAPSRTPLSPDAEELLRLAQRQSQEELDALRLELTGLT